MIHWCNIQTVIFAKIKDTQSFVDSQKVGGRQQAHEMTKERDRETEREREQRADVTAMNWECKIPQKERGRKRIQYWL